MSYFAKSLKLAKMMNADEAEICLAKAYFAPCCPAQVKARPRSLWSLDQFRFGSQIGAGHSSIVYLVWDSIAHVSLALKCYPGAAVKPESRKKVAHEISIHSRLHHPNILPLYGAFVENNDVLLIMPYASQGSVYRLLSGGVRPCAEDFAVSCIIRPFLEGLAYLHSMGIMHRDIKTENVVVDEHSRVMIADFGLAIDTHTASAHHRVGTPLYMAPEVFDIQASTQAAQQNQADITEVVPSPHMRLPVPAPSTVTAATSVNPCGSRNAGYSDKADCWSAAVFIYEVLTGSTPFAHVHHRKALERAILFNPIPPPPRVSATATDFLLWALNRMPHLRPSVHDMIRHPWLTCDVSVQAAPAAATASSADSSRSASGVRCASAPGAVTAACSMHGGGESKPDATAPCIRDPTAGLKGSPSWRIVGFDLAPEAEASNQLPSTPRASRVQPDDDAPPGTAHEASATCLHSTATTATISPQRSPSHGRLLQDSTSTRSCTRISTCLNPSRSSVRTSQQSHSGILCSASHACGPSRVSSLTQALLQQKEASLSSPHSPLHSGVPHPSMESFPSSRQYGTTKGDTEDVHADIARTAVSPSPPCQRASALPQPVVTIVYACDAVVSLPHAGFGLPSIQEGAGESEHTDKQHSTGSIGDAEMDPKAGPASESQAGVGSELRVGAAPVRPPPPALPEAPDSVMKLVAASAFCSALAPTPFQGACAHPSSGAARSCSEQSGPEAQTAPNDLCVHDHPTHACTWCRDCSPAADSSSHLRPVHQSAENSVTGVLDEVVYQHTEPPSVAAKSKVLDSCDGAVPGNAMTAPPSLGHGEGSLCTPACTEDVRCALEGVSVNEDRYYEVRGSWGGSIDSTAGAIIAHVSKQLQAVQEATMGAPPGPGGQMRGRVASWVADAASVQWDEIAEDDLEEGVATCASGCEVLDRPLSSSRVDSGGAMANVLHDVKIGAADMPTGSALVAELQGHDMLSEVSRASSDPDFVEAAAGMQVIAPGQLNAIARIWQREAGKNGGRDGSSGANSVLGVPSALGEAEFQAVASSVSFLGGGDQAWQSYGVDGSTESLHALAGALTPSMNDPSLLHASPVLTEVRGGDLGIHKNREGACILRHV